MKTDLEYLMSEGNIDALLVSGGTLYNPSMHYLTHGAQVGEATLLIKKRGAETVLIAIDMEREEAEKSGLTVIDRADYSWPQLIKEQGGDYLMASVSMIVAIFRDLQVSGNIAVYGRAEHAHTLRLFEELKARLPEVHFVAESAPSILEQAQQTKDEHEVARIRRLASASLEVISCTREFLASHSVENETLITARGTPLTVRDVKGEIRRWTFERNMELPHGFIFSIGGDSAVPHSRGEDESPVVLGRTIVFDYFPCETGGGYFYDFTRTWCLGHAPPEVERAYEDVCSALELAMSSLRAGNLCADSQREVNDFFEARDHPTLRSSPGTREGYLHSLGHGVGLSLHEHPKLSEASGEQDKLQPCTVLTIEPGLYYPDQGYGIRIEDMCWIDQKNGKAETIGEFDRELIVSV